MLQSSCQMQYCSTAVIPDAGIQAPPTFSRTHQQELPLKLITPTANQASSNLAGERTCRQALISDASPTRAPELAARYTSGSLCCRAYSVMAPNTASSRGPNEPELKVMSLAIATT